MGDVAKISFQTQSHSKQKKRTTYKVARLKDFVPHRSRLSNTQQRDSNGGRSREQTEGRLSQSKIVGIDGRCGEKLFSSTVAYQTRGFETANDNRPLTTLPRRNKQCESLYAHKKKRLPNDSRSCHIVPNHRTFIDDYLKILDFIDWLKVAYPEKAKFLTEKSSG